MAHQPDIPRSAGVASTAEGTTLQSIAAGLYCERRYRDTCFPVGTFGEPAWDLLLALYIARDEERSVAVFDVPRLAATTKGAAPGLLRMLEGSGLVSRRPSAIRKSRQLVELTDTGVDRMTDFLARLL